MIGKKICLEKGWISGKISFFDYPHLLFEFFLDSIVNVERVDKRSIGNKWANINSYKNKRAFFYLFLFLYLFNIYVLTE